MTPDEEYWNNRTVAETKAALQSEDPRIASLHVDLATKCLRKALSEREQSETRKGPPPAHPTEVSTGEGPPSQ